MRLVASAGDRFGNRSHPRVPWRPLSIRRNTYFGGVAFSDSVFYLAGQLVSGVVIFQLMLGLDERWALGITTAVLLFYVMAGGAHADILTDGLQGAMMIVLATVVILLTLLGFGIDGSFSGVIQNLHNQDPVLTSPLNPGTPLYHSWWSIFVIAFAHLPLGLLPHLGNKLWALKSDGDQMQFIKLAFFLVFFWG